MKQLRLIAVWMLLLALPLQGLAAFAPSASCADAPAVHSMHDGQQSHHDAAAPHDHGADHPQQDNHPPTDQANGHSCCHHVFSGVPSTAIPGMPVPPLAITSRVAALTTLFIPELPPRPPRA